MNIEVSNHQTDLPLDLKKIKLIVQEFLKLENETCHEVSLSFVDTATICKLHQDFFNDPSPTDCISFPLDEEKDSPYRLLGEVFVCPATALDYATKNHLNPYEETVLYILHGLLHLIGYDDLNEKESFLMRKAETRHLHHLRDKNLL